MSESSIFEDILLNPLMDSVTWCETLLWSPLQIPSTIAPLWGDLFKHYGRPIGWRCISKYDLTRAFFLPTEVQDSSRALTRFFFSSGGIMSAVGCDPGNVIQMSCIMGLAAPPPHQPRKRRAFGLRALSQRAGSLWTSGRTNNGVFTDEVSEKKKRNIFCF